MLGKHLKLSEGDVIDEYTVVKKIGQGRFSTVYCVRDATSQEFAMKAYRNGHEKYYANEVRMLWDERVIVIEGVINYYKTFVHLNFVDGSPRIHPCIIMELCEGHFCADEPLDEAAVKEMMRQLLTVINELHEMGIIHTDVKLENIFTLGGNIILGDLGSSCFEDQHFARTIGTYAYMAPELIVNEPYDRSVDIWAAFVVCFELLTGNSPFSIDGDSESESESESESAESTVSEFSMESNSDDDDAEDYSTCREYLMKIEAVVGTPPQTFTRRKKSRAYYNKKGRILGNPKIEHEGLTKLSLSDGAQEFLLAGLQFDRAERITASAAINHPWLHY